MRIKGTKKIINPAGGPVPVYRSRPEVAPIEIRDEALDNLVWIQGWFEFDGAKRPTRTEVVTRALRFYRKYLERPEEIARFARAAE